MKNNKTLEDKLMLGMEGYPAVHRFLEEIYNSNSKMSEPLAHTILSIISVTHYEQEKLDGIISSGVTYKDYMNAA